MHDIKEPHAKNLKAKMSFYYSKIHKNPRETIFNPDEN